MDAKPWYTSSSLRCPNECVESRSSCHDDNWLDGDAPWWPHLLQFLCQSLLFIFLLCIRLGSSTLPFVSLCNEPWDDGWRESPQEGFISLLLGKSWRVHSSREDPEPLKWPLRSKSRRGAGHFSLFQHFSLHRLLQGSALSRWIGLVLGSRLSIHHEIFLACSPTSACVLWVTMARTSAAAAGGSFPTGCFSG